MKFPRGNYDNEQIDNLLSALNQACKELGIADADQKRRERVAILMMSLANSGQHDAEMLKTYAIEQFESAR